MRLNRDPTFTWVDHILPAVVSLDYGRLGASWLDFRSPGDNYGYQVIHAMLQRDSISGVLNEYESTAWPTGALYFQNGGSFSAWYGDINAHANGRDHAHFFEESTPLSTHSQVSTSTQGPFSRSP